MKAVRNAWYCAALTHELSSSHALSRRILDQNLVLFRDAGGTARALNAICPHRGADLSRGVVRDGHISCPLHRWRFDPQGTCVHIPSQPTSAKISPQARVRAYVLRESQGVVWIWLGDTCPTVAPPRYDFWDENRGQRRLFDRPRLWRCTFVNAVENALDLAHPPFVHTRTFGTDQPELIARQQITVDPDQRGFTGHDDPDAPWKAPRSSGIPGGFAGLLARAVGVRKITRQYYRFDLGGTVLFYIEFEGGAFDVLFAHATPADSMHTWFFGGSTRSRALHAVGDLIQRRFLKLLSDEDEVELSTMWSNDEAALPNPVSTPADEITLAFRHVLQRAIRDEASDEKLTRLRTSPSHDR